MKKKHGLVVVRSALLRAAAIRGGTGAGVHGDRRTKRNRTRSEQKRRALDDQN